MPVARLAHYALRAAILKFPIYGSQVPRGPRKRWPKLRVIISERATCHVFDTESRKPAF